MFLGNGVGLAAVGVVIGLGIDAGLMRFMRSLLFEVSPLDPMTYAIVPLLLIAAAALASYLPARTASSLDPTQALKSE
jgi:ABC-type antimicrobial peptide transport system permease subunit